MAPVVKGILKDTEYVMDVEDDNYVVVVMVVLVLMDVMLGM